MPSQAQLKSFVQMVFAGLDLRAWVCAACPAGLGLRAWVCAACPALMHAVGRRSVLSGCLLCGTVDGSKYGQMHCMAVDKLASAC
jgi:hypothetical protein